jgi:predicted HTH transcriptional regulator
MALTDVDILARLVATEDGTAERKTFSDNRDWIKAAVAFSNSLENDQPGVLFVGVFNDGRIQDQGTTNFEELQKRISGELSNIYPPIYPTILVREKEGKRFIAVIVYGSPERPHFAGKSYIRDGTQTKEASETNIQEFIARRNSNVAEILKWRNKAVTLHILHPPEAALRVGRVATVRSLTVHDCNPH